jgi:hypothetical protein
MKSRKEKVINPPSAPATLGNEDLSKVTGGTQFPPGQFPGDIPPGQFPSEVKPGWHPGK